jgi:hypothetical protein
MTNCLIIRICELKTYCSMVSKKGEGYPEQVSVRTLPHGVSILEISDTL